MSKEFELIPKLRKEILDAVNDRKLVLFLGAGVSVLTGLPLWNELANNLAKKCISENCITYGDAEIVFSKITDTKQKISVIYELFDQHKKTDIFYQCLENNLSCASVLNDRIKSSDQIMRFLAQAVLLLKSKDTVFWECLVNLSTKFDCYLSEELHELLKKYYNSRKSYVLYIIKNIVKYSKWNVFGYERDYDDLILMIKNDSKSKERFYEINNLLLKMNITRFTE